MTGNEEFEPLDELFRKTFQDLSDKPAVTGWDTPSPRVWQRVQTEIKPPATTGWAGQTWAFVALVAVLLGAGVYYASGKLRPAPQPVPAPLEQPVAAPAPVVTPPQEVTPTAPAEKEIISPSAKTRPTAAEQPRTNPAVNSSPSHETETEPGRTQASPLPGSKPVSPNSTMREKSKDGQRN